MDNTLSLSPLIAFPPEIWASVVRLLSGEQLGRLKMTGSTSFWQKLCQPRVVRSVEFGFDFLCFSSLPSFVSEFPALEKLSITQMRVKIRLKLDVIPATVRELSLRGFKWKCNDFFTGKDGKQLSLIEYLPHLESLDMKIVYMQDYTWMLQTPSSLTELKIAYWDAKTPLPPTLIHFEALETHITSLPSGFSMPRQLESLRTTKGYLDFTLVLPYLSETHFQRLTCDCRPVGTSFPLEKLPRSTTCLNFRWKFDFVKSPESISLLPPNLTDLWIPSSLPSSLWSKLPPQLKNLFLRVSAASLVETTIISPINGQSHQVQAIPLCSLPKSITDLCISYKDSNPDAMAQCFCTPLLPADYFPPHLTSLEVYATDISVAAASCLPASLTILRLRNLCERICEHLPRGLKNISSETTLMSPNLIKFLPKSLTYLYLRGAEPKAPWYDQNICKRLNTIDELPEFVHHENFGANIDWKGEWSLPPSLTCLALCGCKNIGDSFFRNQQLPNLTRLSLPDTNKITDAAIPFLGSCLLALELGASYAISGRCFRSLPRSLTYLDLRSSSVIFDIEIQHLPRGLTRAILSAATRLTDQCVKYLPRRLHFPELKENHKITPASKSHFPYQ